LTLLAIETRPLRRIRSFVRREGRLTPAQQRALEHLWPRYGIEPTPGDSLDLDTLFGRSAPRVVEIGFGNGESLAALATAWPDHDFIGIEVHRPGVGHLLNLIADNGLTNLRLVNGDAVEFIQHHIGDGTLDRILLLFPDPWPKTRHHKRRQVQPVWADLMRQKLKIGGLIHLATDWEAYAGQMVEVMSATTGLLNRGSPFISRPDYRLTTRFEQRGLHLGHEVWDLLFERVS
jgi:tRNA (guanine-N7-)-methyltransferase